MSSFLLFMARFFLNMLYGILKCLPVSDKVTFLSRQANTPGVDFVLLEKQMHESYPEYKTVMLCKTLGTGVSKKIRYTFHMFRQMFHCATSRAVVLDSYCIVISFLKQKKSLPVFQIWHGTGLIKKFGYAILDKKEGSERRLAKNMRMHRNYSYVVCSSPEFTGTFAEIFDCGEEKILPLGLPRMDYLQSPEHAKANRTRLYALYPELKNGKKTILYVPTFRKFGKVPTQKVIDKVNLTQYNLIVKLHGGKEQVFVDSKNQKRTGRSGPGMDFIHIADFVITDYSAILYEAALVRKPLYLYCCDYDSYMEDRGLFIDYFNEIPGVVSKDIDVIVNAIDEGVVHDEKLESFLDKNVPYRQLNITSALCDLIVQAARCGKIDLDSVIHSKKYLK